MVDVSRRSTTPIVQLLRCTIWGGLATFALVAFMFAAQRLAGGSSRSLDSFTTVALVAFVSLLALLLRLPRGRGVTGSSEVERWGVLFLPGICLLLLGIAVSSPDTSPVAFVMVWLLIFAEEGYLLYRERANLQWPWPSTARQSTRPHVRSEVSSRTPQPLTDDERLPINVTQSIVRMRDANIETISGTLRAEFQAGERTVYTHVGFCPPLACSPQIEVEQTDGPDATIKIAQVLPHGARFDVRLQKSTDQAERVELAFHAEANERRRHEDTETK